MTVSKYYNPFQREELRYPTQYHEDVLSFSQTRTDGEGSDPDKSPFPRYVDIWFLSACIGARMGKRTQVTRENSHKFIEGSIFQSDPWRVEMLELLVIGFTGDPHIIRSPREVIQIANDLAATGMPEVVAMLRSSQDPPIWNLSDRLVAELESPYESASDPAPVREPTAGALEIKSPIEALESKVLEFKGSLRFDAATGQTNKDLTRSVIKTISAFLNTSGGILLVGVNDKDQLIVGIEQDFPTLGKKGNRDGWELNLRNAIKEMLPGDVGPLVDVRFHQAPEGTVAIIQCEQSMRAVFVTEGKSVTFYVRSGNSSQPLDVRATSEYIRAHWPPGL